MQLIFHFVNPNTPKEFERQLQTIVMEKLLSQQAIADGNGATNK